MCEQRNQLAYSTSGATLMHSTTEYAMNLVLTADLLVKRISTLLQPFNLTPAFTLVLNIVANSESPLPPNEITDWLIVSRATVTDLLDSL
jgi:DNA-binding MarR family transcriptional regulator